MIIGTCESTCCFSDGRLLLFFISSRQRFRHFHLLEYFLTLTTSALSRSHDVCYRYQRSRRDPIASSVQRELRGKFRREAHIDGMAATRACCEIYNRECRMSSSQGGGFCSFTDQVLILSTLRDKHEGHCEQATCYSLNSRCWTAATAAIGQPPTVVYNHECQEWI